MFLKSLLVMVLVFSFAGASYAQSYQDRLIERQYRNAVEVGCEAIEVKSPATALVLGLLPGGGSFYTGQFTLGIADALLWPFFSTIWDSPLAYKRAQKMNMEETIYVCKQKKKIK
jgi:hypothetical protein